MNTKQTRRDILKRAPQTTQQNRKRHKNREVVQKQDELKNSLDSGDPACASLILVLMIFLPCSQGYSASGLLLGAPSPRCKTPEPLGHRPCCSGSREHVLWKKSMNTCRVKGWTGTADQRVLTRVSPDLDGDISGPRKTLAVTSLSLS